MYCGQYQLEKRVDIARRGSERENDILPDHYGGLLAEGGVLTSLEWLFSWSCMMAVGQNGWSWDIVSFCH